MAWTDERRELVVKLWKEGLSASGVAQRVGGTTRNAVIGIIHRMGLSGRSAENRMKSRKRKIAAQASYARGQEKRRARLAELKSREPKRERFFGDVQSVAPLPLPLDTDIARVSFAELEPGMCKFIPGDPRASGPMFCGCAVVPGLSWCEAHARRVFNAPAVSSRVSEPTKELEHA